MKYYILAFKNYFNFSGRATRREYWMFVLFHLLFAFVIIFLESLIKTEGLFYLLYIVLTIIPGLSIAIRRLHDTGRSGFYILLSLIPFIGSIWVLILLILKSQKIDNKYGPFRGKINNLTN